MEAERIELSTRERDRLQVLHEVQQGHRTQPEAGRWLQWSDRPVRRRLVRLRTAGDRGRVHRLRGRPSNRKIAGAVQQRALAADYAVPWQGQRWGLPREQVCGGLRGAQAEIERWLDGRHGLRFRGRYLPLRRGPAAAPGFASPSGLRPPGLAEPKPTPKSKYHPPPAQRWRRPWKRTLLLCRKPDISPLR